MAPRQPLDAQCRPHLQGCGKAQGHKTQHTHTTNTQTRTGIENVQVSCSHIQLQPAIAKILVSTFAFCLSISALVSMAKGDLAGVNLVRCSRKAVSTSCSMLSATHMLNNDSANRDPPSTRARRAVVWLRHSTPARTTVAKSSLLMRREHNETLEEHQSMGQSVFATRRQSASTTVSTMCAT